MNKVYLLYESLYGELLCECDSTSIIGLYDTLEKAIERAKYEIEQDTKCNNYVLDNENYDIENGYARLFYNNQENWGCYFEMFIKEMEVKR